MSIDEKLVEAAKQLVGAADKLVDESLPAEIAEIVKLHSKGAAASGVAAGWIPGAAGVAAAVVSGAFIWSMYGRINAAIDVPIAENVLKSLGSGIATNLAAYFLGGGVVAAVLSFFPGVGSVGASAVVGMTAYALTLASGYVYLQVLTQLFLSGRDPTKMDAESLKNAATSVIDETDVRGVIEEAKAAYKR